MTTSRMSAASDRVAGDAIWTAYGRVAKALAALAKEAERIGDDELMEECSYLAGLADGLRYRYLGRMGDE